MRLTCIANGAHRHPQKCSVAGKPWRELETDRTGISVKVPRRVGA